MKLFNLDNNGATELVNVMGLIDQDLEWDKWEPILPLAIREVESIVGADVMDALDAVYRSDVRGPWENEAVRLSQQAVAMFAWLKVIPTLDAQHSTAGRGKHLGENERGMTAVQEYKDEENIRSMAYAALDALYALMEREKPDWWLQSTAKMESRTLLIRSKEEFDRYYKIGSHRLFLTLVPMIREVQDVYIAPIIGYDNLKQLLSGTLECATEYLQQMVKRPLALLTMKRAVERLPIEVLPEGVVQVQQSGMVRDRVKAEAQARNSVAQNLDRDAREFLNALTNEWQRLTRKEVEPYVPEATVNQGGITF